MGTAPWGPVSADRCDSARERCTLPAKFRGRSATVAGGVTGERRRVVARAPGCHHRGMMSPVVPLPPSAPRVLLSRWPDDPLTTALAAAGAIVTAVPLTRVTPLPPDELRRVALTLSEGFDWIAVTSATTVAVLAGLGLEEATARLAAVGPATARALSEAGFVVALQPDLASGGAALAAAWPAGAGRVAIPGARDSAPALAEGLRAKGWTVTAFPVYDVAPVSRVDPAVAAAWLGGALDVFVVTAGSVARAARDLLGPGGPPVIALGEPSARAAREAGFDVHGVSGDADPAAVVAALRSFVQGDH